MGSPLLYSIKRLITNYLAVKEDITINKLIQTRYGCRYTAGNITDAVICDHDYIIIEFGCGKCMDGRRGKFGKNLMNILNQNLLKA
jgi:hypothetical protein